MKYKGSSPLPKKKKKKGFIWDNWPKCGWVGFTSFSHLPYKTMFFFSFLFFWGGLPLEENSKTINIKHMEFKFICFFYCFVKDPCDCYNYLLFPFTLFEKTDEDAECDAATSQGFSQLVPSFLFFCSHEKLFCQRRSYFIGTIKLC